MAACARTMFVGVKLVEALGIFMSPFMPSSAARLREFLNLPKLAPGDWDAPSRIAGGHVLGPAEVLFPKLDDQTIQPHIDKLRGAR